MVGKVKGGPNEHEPEYVICTKKNYVWFETAVFTLWEDGKTCKVLCVDAPPDLPRRLMEALWERPSSLDFQDPFAMHTNLLDQIIVYYDILIWRIRDPIRKLERVSI